jgi:hypothetical protein
MIRLKWWPIFGDLVAALLGAKIRLFEDYQRPDRDTVAQKLRVCDGAEASTRGQTTLMYGKWKQSAFQRGVPSEG